MVATISHIKNVVGEYFKDKPVKVVYLFGSYARGEANENSDVDLLIHYDKKQVLSFYDVIRLKLELEKKLNKRVELVEENLMYSKFRSFVDNDKIKIYEA